MLDAGRGRAADAPPWLPAAPPPAAGISDHAHVQIEPAAGISDHAHVQNEARSSHGACPLLLPVFQESPAKNVHNGCQVFVAWDAAGKVSWTTSKSGSYNNNNG
eukprot:1161049-Pelagomonas_calceolata.AAC.13